MTTPICLLATLTRAELLPALQAAYDPTMPDWPSMVEIEE